MCFVFMVYTLRSVERLRFNILEKEQKLWKVVNGENNERIKKNRLLKSFHPKITFKNFVKAVTQHSVDPSGHKVIKRV